MSKKYGASLMIIVIMTLAFSFVANVEYGHRVKQEQDSLKEDLINVQTNIENMISSRIINASVFAGLIEIDKSIDNKAFDTLAQRIYSSESQVVKDIVFITDTTISHVYPNYLGDETIGIDLSTITEQRDLLLYTKEQNKTVFFGPVDLVEGGQGIIVRVPIVVEENYYGQIAIVFDYLKFIEESGLKNLAMNNQVFLDGNNPLSNQLTTIWSNGYEEPKDFVDVMIYMHDIKWTIEASPIEGWQGDSPLFYLIIIVGVFVCIGATIAFLTEYSLKEKLEVVNAGLLQNVTLLAENKKELVEKYNEIREKEAYIQNLADRDELTGLYNRRLFREHLEAAIKEGIHGLVVLIDIDDFKNINDIHGHLYGDELLKAFAKSMDNVLEKECQTYRFGGDEFLVLFKNDYDDKAIMLYSQLVKDKLTKIISDKISSPITLSTGVVRYPGQGNDVESLLIRADVAMYKSKNTGKNKVTIFEESLLLSLDYKVGIDSHIRKALANNGFSMYYQPIIDAISGVIVSFEALIRLNDRCYSPMEFIEVAESTGFIVPLGEWILEEVFTTISNWLTEGLNPKPVAINLSPRQLIVSSFRDMFFKKIEKANIPMDLIEIEITENIFLENEEENIAILRELRGCGVKVSMDDFGTGYSSLKYLTYLPLDKVKIDKSLKDHLLLLDNTQVLSGIITMVHGLGMKVVAEGIEEEKEWELLERIGCDYLQGYLFSKPVQVDLIPGLLSGKPYTKT